VTTHLRGRSQAVRPQVRPGSPITARTGDRTGADVVAPVRTRVRDPHIDNVRALLLALVVVGHTVGQFVDAASGASTLYTWIYLFHMPAFVLLCGVLSTRPELDAARSAAMLRTLVLPFVVLQVVFTAWFRFLGNPLPWTVEGLLEPVYHLWFLAALFLWKALAPFVARIRLPVVLAIGASLGAGTVATFGDALAVNRVVALLPFFVIGMVLGSRALALPRTRLVRGAAAAVLVVSVPAAGVFHDEFGRSWLFWRSTYRALEVTAVEGMTIRMLMIVWALAMTAALIVLVPRRRMPFAVWGERSMYPYVLHAFVVQAFGAADLAVATVWEFALCVLGAVALTAILASAPVATAFRPLLEPRGRWLLR
jgi:fucose 4-O-acetylase-like acetyltransferase